MNDLALFYLCFGAALALWVLFRLHQAMTPRNGEPRHHTDVRRFVHRTLDSDEHSPAVGALIIAVGVLVSVGMLVLIWPVFLVRKAVRGSGGRS